MNSGDGLAHRIRTRACGIVTDRAAQHLLLVQVEVPTRSEPIWMPPGGEVNAGETLREAATREVIEETGLSVRVDELLSVHEFISPPFHALEYYFHAIHDQEITEKRLQVSQSEDPRVQSIVWVNKKDFTNCAMQPSYLKTLILSLFDHTEQRKRWPVFHQTIED